MKQYSKMLNGKFALTVAVLITTVMGVASDALAQSATTSDFGIPEVKFINQQIRQQWTDYQIKPSMKATEGEWVRRVYLDIIGRVPTVEELQAYTSDRDREKKVKLVQSLLHDEKHTEEYAKNWTTIWTNVLIGRSGGTEQNSLTNREGLQKFLRDSFECGSAGLG